MPSTRKLLAFLTDFQKIRRAESGHNKSAKMAMQTIRTTESPELFKTTNERPAASRITSLCEENELTDGPRDGEAFETSHNVLSAGA